MINGRCKKLANGPLGYGGIAIIFLFTTILVIAFIHEFVTSASIFNITLRKHFVLVILAIICIEFILFFFLRRPLSYTQLETLSHNQFKRHFRWKYHFSKRTVHVSSDFKSQLDRTGRWYNCRIKTSVFPSYVSSLLFGKKHEWVVIGLERNGYISQFWANKGPDSSHVAFSVELNTIIEKCHRNGYHTVIRIHNHPNPNPNRYDTLIESRQDIRSAKSCAKEVSREGVNWIDFVCSRGEFIKFYSKISNKGELDGKKATDYVDKVGINPIMDYFMQMRYVRSFFIYRLAVVLLILLEFINVLAHVKPDNIKDESNTQIVSSELSEETEPVIVEESADNYVNAEITEISILSVNADSEYRSSSGKDYSATQMIDGDYSTCWQDGSSGYGIGEVLSFEFEEAEIDLVRIVNGNRVYEGSYNLNGRLSDATLSFYLDGILVNEEIIHLEDTSEEVALEFSLSEPVTCNKMFITIDEVYEGVAYTDTAVSEVMIIGRPIVE